MLIDCINLRLKLGRERYGHGVIIDDDTSQYGTRKNDWLEMAEEEILDGIIYIAAAIIRKERKDGKRNKNNKDNCFLDSKTFLCEDSNCSFDDPTFLSERRAFSKKNHDEGNSVFGEDFMKNLADDNDEIVQLIESQISKINDKTDDKLYDLLNHLIITFGKMYRYIEAEISKNDDLLIF